MKIGIYANIKKEEVLNLLPEILTWLSGEGAESVITRDIAERLHGLPEGIRVTEEQQLSRESEIILALGGDGTMLAAFRLIRDTLPLIGINLGGLGFLTEISLPNLYPSLKRVLAGDFTIEQRMVLEAELKDAIEEDRFFALNDLIIFRGGSLRMVRLRVDIDGKYFNTYISDGLIVSTPTGSTAYSLSAGGPIVMPHLQSIILNPICPHALTVRPVVIDAGARMVIRIESPPEGVQLTADGQQRIDISKCREIIIRRADFSAKLASFNEKSFFDRLREKLQWGGLPHK